MLDRIREDRDDAREDQLSAAAFADVPLTDLPPCKGESGAFMSPEPWQRFIDHPYQTLAATADTHGHLRRTLITVPAYSTLAIPFWWLQRGDTQDEIAERTADPLPPDDEPPFPTNWVFGRRRQEALLRMFWDQVKPGALVFFYTKQGQPIHDSINRLVVGAGLITEVGKELEYESEGSKRTPPVWERLIGHSIRPDGAEGLLLPYHAYLEPTGDHVEDDRRKALLREIAVVPDVGHLKTFTYFAEHATPDVALSVLVQCMDAVRRVREHGIAAGPWDLREDWLNAQIARTWTERGAFPGLGSALEAIGMRLGTALALDLIADGTVATDDDPWPVTAAILEGRQEPPKPAYKADLAAVAGTWAKLPPQRRAVLQLLSRFALSPAQALRLFDPHERDAAFTAGVSDQDILANPYRIVECDLGEWSAPAVSVGVVDRGLLPSDTVAAKSPVPEPSALRSASDPRRVRAATVSVLRRAAAQGDSLLSAQEALGRIDRLDLAKPLVIPYDWYRGNEEKLRAVVGLLDIEVPEGPGGPATVISALQLAQHAETERRLSRILLRRAGKPVQSTGAKWRDLLVEAITESGATIDETDARHQDALGEQQEALERITTHRLGVLVGRAGSGKTSVLGALVKCDAIASEGVLLLAPTGKARVRLQRATRRQADTVAGFLNKLGRYDGDRQRPLFAGTETHRKEKTVVIDECSMLTMDDLYAVLLGLDLGHVERLILVGDPNQLPPIGVGRPFADLIGALDGAESAEEQAAADALAGLTVEVRTAQGAASDALRLAAWFTSEPQPKDADQVLSDIELGGEFNDLTIAAWRTPAELQLRLIEQLQERLDLDGPNDVAGFDRALGLTPEGWVPFEDHDGVENFQVLSPVRSHPHGTFDLNRWFQSRFRKRGRSAQTLGDEEIGFKDKVIQLRNGTRRGWSKPSGKVREYIANGEIGTMAEAKNGHFNVAFAGRSPIRFSYWAGAFGEDDVPLELAYAITVHKAQGSDFEVVFLVLPRTRMLSRELLYTGLTRAKKHLVLLVEGDDASTLFDWTLPEKSETARRNTNLFRGAVREDEDQVPYAEHLIHRLSDGRMVRSKSELVIAVEMQRLGMWDRCYYERPLSGTSRSGRVWPDFTFIDAAGDPIIWEHLGMLSKQSYRESWDWKVQWYRDNGFELGVNLFTTEDDPAGGLSQDSVTEVATQIRDEL